MSDAGDVPSTSAGKRRAESVRKLHSIMLRETASKVRTNRRLVEACSCQSSLAHYSDSAEKIESMSLNTLKKTADRVVEDGGWAPLD
jgi:hypothetical protein